MWLLLLFLLSRESKSTVSPCDILSDGIDMESRHYKKEVQPAQWWSYTPPHLKGQLQEENLITAYVQLTQVEQSIYLNLNIEMYSPNTVKQYGNIERGSLLTIDALDGRQYKLQCHTGNKKNNKATYSKNKYVVSYKLSKSDEKSLHKSLIDEVGIQWSSGYEVYTVYNVDIIKNQLECLKYKKKKQN